MDNLFRIIVESENNIFTIKKMSISLVTGCAGFIGSNLCEKLLKDGKNVIGVDNFNNYYDPKIKKRNISKILKNKKFKLLKLDILNKTDLDKIFEKNKIDSIVHLAARAGVRPSIENPYLYAQTNVLGTVNLLELAVKFKLKKFVFASSSSVYGNSKKLPFDEEDLCQEIVSPYGASKRAAEFFVESFFKTYGLNAVILRFFTVYGPGGRPDMAPAIFTRRIASKLEISRFGDGNSARDFTYVADIIEGITAALKEDLRFEIINLGDNNPVRLDDFIKIIEEISRKKARIKVMPFQSGDTEKTWANINKAKNLLNWKPKTKISDGMRKYYEWYLKNGN